MNQSVSKATLGRLPMYLSYLKSIPTKEVTNISAASIAEALNLHPVQVRKDLALISEGGKPKTGYVAENLLRDLEKFLGYNNVNCAVIVGVGHLGQALMSYEGFSQYGLKIVATFDVKDTLIDKEIHGKKVFSIDKIPYLCPRLCANIGIITVPAEAAQSVCDKLVEAGIRAIWNFAPVILNVPEGILVQNENMAASLAVLSNHLSETMNKS